MIIHRWIHSLLELFEEDEQQGDPIIYQLVILEDNELEDWLGANNIFEET